MDDEVRLSVVVTSRNDGHGGALLERFRTFADALVAQARECGLNGELVVVEWNPPDGPLLADVLELRERWDGFPVRFIAVPGTFHEALPNAEAIPLFQMIAKNVGIRRARGRFVLATNPDLLFSSELVRFLASAELDPGVMYRLDRTDVAAEVPEADLDQQLAWCREHVLRVHTRWGTLPSLEVRVLARTFGRLARERLQGFAWDLRRSGKLGHGSSLSEPLRAASRWVLTLIQHFLGPLTSLLARTADALRVLASPVPKVHTNGCGDFTLLSREAWHRLRGYAELPIWSMHLDSLLCYSAVAAGYTERVLRRPAAMYHLEHGRSWVALDATERLRTFARKPWLDSDLLRTLWHEMFVHKEPVLYNDIDWGLGKQDLPETRGEGRG